MAEAVSAPFSCSVSLVVSLDTLSAPGMAEVEAASSGSASSHGSAGDLLFACSGGRGTWGTSGTRESTRPGLYRRVSARTDRRAGDEGAGKEVGKIRRKRRRGRGRGVGKEEEEEAEEEEEENRDCS